MRKVRRLIPSTKELHGHSFFIKENGRWVATPLMMTLLFIEITDVIFAVDSIPAIFAVTLDPFIVFTSNIFAILGLRSLFFAFAGLVDKFRYLKVGLSAILIFVGIKMTIIEFYKIPSLLSLLVIVLILTVAIVASILRAPRVSAEPSRESTG
jgi:tellurite resistance protein TerC